ncbi:DUF4157 domain-containing protein [Nostoc sp. CHAB 5834]|nr:DUF4157 domain-containing protein [Nostoc sp. CHAB 5834]
MKSTQSQPKVATADSHQAQAHQSGAQGVSRSAVPNGISLPVQRQPNRTGRPDQLKAGVENYSGHSLDDVNVHYNSAKPAQLQAHAYAQGTDIHVAPGQEKHLPHEAWHVVQQKQGRVKPTIQMKGSVAVNDDKGLEKEADVMGESVLKSVNKASRENLVKETTELLANTRQSRKVL